MNELAAVIQAEIGKFGPIRFDRFMELALYHPRLGYYRCEGEKPRTGREGDFFTSASVGPLFGRLLARQFLEMWEKLKKPDRFWIAEQGAENAELATDILSWSRAQAPHFHEALQYALIEEHPSLRLQQQEKLRAEGLFAKANWYPSVFDWAAEEPVGVFFSNELVDAFPVRIVVWKNGAWHERYITRETNDSFEWTEMPVGSSELTHAIQSLSLPELEGYTTEINLRARDWMAAVGRSLKRGYVLTLDYGFPAAIYYAPFRRDGTLTAYREHRRSADFLRDPGAYDLTAHVDFTALEQAGERSGFTNLGFVDQQHFLTGIAQEELGGTGSLIVGIQENLRAWQTLTHPSHLGSRFQVLLQARDAPSDLAGLRYARSDRAFQSRD